MSFTKCIKDKVAKGVLKQADVNALEKEYNELVARYTSTMGDQLSAEQAAADIINVKKSQLAQKRRNDITAALHQEKVVAEVERIKTEFNTTTSQAYVAVMEKAYARKNAVLRESYSHLNEFVEKFRSKTFGLTADREGLQDVVREMLGENTGNAEASGYGKALRSTFDIMHKRFRNAGGIIGKLDNYFPQVHMRERIKDVSFDEWYETLRPKLDVGRMVDFETGLPFTDARLKEVMQRDYEDIITNGRSSLKERVQRGLQTFGTGKDVSQRRQASRFYHFKDAQAFLDYNKVFGLGDEGLYDAITGVMETMSRDIGIMEVMGAKPNALHKHMQLRMKADEDGVVKQGWANGAFDVLTGRTDADLTNDSLGGRAIQYLHNTQNVLRSALLGSAPISALSDGTFVVAAARMQGLSGTRAIKKYAKQMSPTSDVDRKLAKRAGYIAEIATQGAMQDMRISGGDMLGNKLTSTLASFTNRASGLAAMTRSARDAVALEFQATFADYQKTSWADLPTEFRKSAKANGFTKEDWEFMADVKLYEAEDGIKFLRQNEVALTGNDPVRALDISNKMDDWITATQNLAVNEPTLKTRSITTGAAFGEAQKGTMLRTTASIIFMFKSFPITVMFNHVLPMLRSAAKGKYEHAATVALGTTLIGGAALQFKEISKGKDARDMSDSKFWIASAMQGGGLGLFGDFLFSDYGRFGRDPLIDFFTGPIGGLSSDILRTFKGNFDRALEGDGDTDKFLRDVFNLVKRNTPAVNLWYSRLMLERLFLDSIEEAIDPKFAKRRQAMERRQYKDYGTRYWWRKGEKSPRRAPEVGDKTE